MACSVILIHMTRGFAFALLVNYDVVSSPSQSKTRPGDPPAAVGDEALDAGPAVPHLGGRWLVALPMGDRKLPAAEKRG